MIRTRASVPTDHASKYLQQLCKHWSHRLDVDFDAQNGRVRFDKVVKNECVATFSATDSDLDILLSAASKASLGMVTKAIEDHLRRFAFREDLSIVWTESNHDR